LEYIPQKSFVVRIPIHCCVTRHYLKSTIIHSVLAQDFYRYNTQELLSTWLALHTDKQGLFLHDSVKEENKFWRPYLESLPVDYSLPCTCHKEEIACMPNYMRNRVDKQREVIDSSYIKLRKYFPALDKQRYEWGYYTVNTRAVFLQKDPRDNGSGEEGENSLALVPFLDLLNHSDDVSVQAGINLSR